MKPTAVEEEVRVQVRTDADIVTARMRGRALAMQLGFPAATATLVATAISELARNILQYAAHGQISIVRVENGSGRGLEIEARDEGPGIPDLARALEDGYSTTGRLGLGLPGVRRLMDNFEIHSKVVEGTIVTAKKWIT